MIEEAAAEAAAQRLFDQHTARARFLPIEPWPEGQGEGFAYAVQAGLLERRDPLGRNFIAGYKIGLTTPRMQKLCRGDRPISGLMAAGGVRASPARVSVSDFVHLGIESELAIRIDSELPGDRLVRRDDVAAAAGAAAASFELIEDRHADYSTLDWRWIAADNSWHAGLVLGAPVATPDIADLTGTLTIDGRCIDSGSTRDVLGHPFDAIAWLANHLAARGLKIAPGHWISTGSIASIQVAEPGRRYRFTIEGLPSVELDTA